MPFQKAEDSVGRTIKKIVFGADGTLKRIEYSSRPNDPPLREYKSVSTLDRDISNERYKDRMRGYEKNWPYLI